VTEHSHDHLADETLRLVSSMQDWARRSLPDDAAHSSGACQWCPLCQFVAMLRGDRPEVTARVAEAGTAVITAMRALLDAAVDAGGSSGPAGAPETGTGRHSADTPASRARPDPAPRVQRIDLSHES
jgi:hypothetical protein